MPVYIADGRSCQYLHLQQMTKSFATGRTPSREDLPVVDAGGGNRPTAGPGMLGIAGVFTTSFPLVIGKESVLPNSCFNGLSVCFLS